MMGFGGDLMLWKKFGVGAEVAFPARQRDLREPERVGRGRSGLNTLAVQSRMTLFDFNGIYQPVSTKKVALKLEGGIGGANLKFYESGSSSSVLGNQNSSQYFGKRQPLSGARRRGRGDLCHRPRLHSPAVRCPLRSQPDAVWKQRGDERDGVAGIQLGRPLKRWLCEFGNGLKQAPTMS